MSRQKTYVMTLVGSQGVEAQGAGLRTRAAALREATEKNAVALILTPPGVGGPKKRSSYYEKNPHTGKFNRVSKLRFKKMMKEVLDAR